MYSLLHCLTVSVVDFPISNPVKLECGLRQCSIACSHFVLCVIVLLPLMRLISPTYFPTFSALEIDGVVTPNFDLPAFDPLMSLQQHNTLQSPHLASPAVPFFPSPPSGMGISVQHIQHTTVSQSVHLPPDDTSKAGLISTYYSYFHPAHPFLLPHFQMLDLLQSAHLPHLELALQYVGSFYVSAAPTGTYQQALHQALEDKSLKRDGYMVQTLLIYAVGLHIADEEELSTTIMLDTINLALELGMNKREFAREAGQHSVLVEEVWRRTWWEIFILDGMFAGVNPVYKMQLHSTKLDVYLPIEDSEVFGLVSTVETLVPLTTVN